MDSPKVGRRMSPGHSSTSRLAILNSNSPIFGSSRGSSITYAKVPQGTGVVSEGTPLIAPSQPSPGIAESARMLSVDDGAMASPPLAVWIGPALACALAYALYNIFIKKGSASINPILGGVILQFVAACLGCVLLGGVIFFNSLLDENGMEKDNVLEWDWTGVQWAILAGFAVGAAEMISFCVSGMGVQAMQSIPVIIGGSVMFGTVLGYTALGETLTMRGWSGVLMISIGISLVGMDDEGTGV